MRREKLTEKILDIKRAKSWTWNQIPSLIETALKRRFRDASLRYSYPLGPSSVEQASDPGSLIFTLQTCDGFGISFTVSRSQAQELSEILASSAMTRTEVVAH